MLAVIQDDRIRASDSGRVVPARVHATMGLGAVRKNKDLMLAPEQTGHITRLAERHGWRLVVLFGSTPRTGLAAPAFARPQGLPAQRYRAPGPRQFQLDLRREHHHCLTSIILAGR